MWCFYFILTLYIGWILGCFRIWWNDKWDRGAEEFFFWVAMLGFFVGGGLSILLLTIMLAIFFPEVL